MRVLGIDEAGRGCVLGPLVVAGYLYEGPDADLVQAGARDSKRLSAKRRAAVREILHTLGTGDARLIPATAIDGGNLNALEEAEVLRLIHTHRPDHVIMDALGHPRTLPALIARLNGALPADLRPTWVVEPKADGTYPVCASASIFAKTTRDAELEAHKHVHGDFGSGYPSDPKTRAWLLGLARAGTAWPAFVRTRWATIDDIVAEAAADISSSA